MSAQGPEGRRRRDGPRGGPGAPGGRAGPHPLLERGGAAAGARALHPEALARARAAQRPGGQYAELAETFRALGDASRARILHALLTEELCVCDLAALAGASESAVSQHLRVLRGLRIVRSRKAGRVVYYTLEDACIRALLAIALTHLDDAGLALLDLPAPAPPRAQAGYRGRHPRAPLTVPTG